MFPYIALYSWPLIMAAFFRACPIANALVISIILGYLFLPPVFVDLPGLPAMGKNTIPGLAAIMAVALMASNKSTSFQNAFSLSGWIPKRAVPRLLLFVLVASPVLTVMTNQEAVFLQGIVLPGLRPWDIIATSGAAVLTILPLLLGRKLLAGQKEQRLLLVTLTIIGSVFCLFALYEIRMSPQLNRIIYGFDAHSWIASWRGGSFRPVVFFVNGLLLALFLSTATLAAVSLIRTTSGRSKSIYILLALWLLFTLILTRSFGALGITFILILPILFLTKNHQILIAAFLSGIVILYPMLRGADLVPVGAIVEWVQGINPDRAHSLDYRLNNEDALLERAGRKPLFGWGSWGRNHLYSDDGYRVSVTDGYWIGSIGVGGWVRYVAEFGLLCLPALLAAFHRKRREFGPEFPLLLIVLTGNLVDLLPNASLSAITWLIAGSVWGRLELEAEKTSPVQETRPVAAPTSSRPVYTRTQTPVKAKPIAAAVTRSSKSAAYTRDRTEKPYSRRDAGKTPENPKPRPVFRKPRPSK